MFSFKNIHFRRGDYQNEIANINQREKLFSTIIEEQDINTREE